MALTDEPLWAIVIPDRPLADCLAGLTLYEAQMTATRLTSRLPPGKKATVRNIQWRLARHACRDAENLPQDREVCEEYVVLVRRIRRQGTDILFYGPKRTAQEAADRIQLPPGFAEVRRAYWWLSD